MTTDERRAEMWKRAATWTEKRHNRRVAHGGVLVGDLIWLWVGTLFWIGWVGSVLPWLGALGIVVAIVLSDRWWLARHHAKKRRY